MPLYSTIYVKPYVQRYNNKHVVLRYIKERGFSDRSIAINTRRAVRYIDKLNALVIETDAEVMQQKEQGKTLTYRGKICLYDLCVDNMAVSIHDISDEVLSDGKCSHCNSRIKQRRGYVAIEAVPLKEMVMSPRIRFVLGNGIKIWVDRNTPNVIGRFY